MNALAYKAHKQGMSHSDIHSITRPHSVADPEIKKGEGARSKS